METPSREFRSYCQQLELARARRLLRRDELQDAAAVERDLLQTILLAALNPAGREQFNFGLWLETLAAVRDPATPRSLPRTAQLLTEEVDRHRQQVKPAVELVAQTTVDWEQELRRLPSLQRTTEEETAGQQLPSSVLSLLAEPQADVERALVANWLEWRATHPCERSRFYAEVQGAPALAAYSAYSAAERIRKGKLLAKKLNHSQRQEFGEAIRSAEATERELFLRQAPPPPAREKKNEQELWGRIFWVLVFAGFLIGYKVLIQDPTIKAWRGKPGTVFKWPGRRTERVEQIPVVDPNFHLAGGASELFFSLPKSAQAELNCVRQFRRWLSLAGEEPERLEDLDSFLLPGPRSYLLIRDKRRTYQREIRSGSPVALRGSRRAISWFRETWPIWQEEIAVRDKATPADRIYTALSLVPDETLAAWAEGDAGAEQELYAALFKDSPHRSQIETYRLEQWNAAHGFVRDSNAPRTNNSSSPWKTSDQTLDKARRILEAIQLPPRNEGNPRKQLP